MTPKNIFVLGLWVLAVVLFALTGLDIEDGSPDFNFVALGLASYVLGVIVHTFVSTP